MRRPKEWPLYLICTGSSSKLPLPLEDLFLVTTSLDFARCVCRRLSQEPTTLIRVTQYNLWLRVAASSLETAKALDKLWPQLPQSVVEEAHCKLCIRSAGANKKAQPVLVGVNALHQAPCRAHQVKWYPQYTHDILKLNALNSLRSQSTKSNDMAALMSAKTEWLGQLYFMKAFRHHLPYEVLERVKEVLC